MDGKCPPTKEGHGSHKWSNPICHRDCFGRAAPALVSPQRSLLQCRKPPLSKLDQIESGDDIPAMRKPSSALVRARNLAPVCAARIFRSQKLFQLHQAANLRRRAFARRHAGAENLNRFHSQPSASLDFRIRIVPHHEHFVGPQAMRAGDTVTGVRWPVLGCPLSSFLQG